MCRYHILSLSRHDVSIGLMNLQKTTIDQYLFLRSLESELAVLEWNKSKNAHVLEDSSGIGVYSTEDLCVV